MPIPTKPGTYQIKAGPVACLSNEKPHCPLWAQAGSSKLYIPDEFAQIWDGYEFERLVPETPQPRERTPVEILRKKESKSALWEEDISIYTPDGARQIAAQLRDAADYREIRDSLFESVLAMNDLLAIPVPRAHPYGQKIEDAIRKEIDQLIRDKGWSCKEEDLDAETERRYLEVR